MRKQYHFWPGEHGLDAWDVDRLIALTRELPVIEVEVASIAEIDTAYWSEPGADPPTVREIVEHVRVIRLVDPSYPVILGVDGRVMDGMHRIARALLASQPRIRAVQLTHHPEPDYRNVRPAELPY